MCGRFARFSPAHIFRMLFQLDEFIDLIPQYNIAPGQDVYTVRGITVRDDQHRVTDSSEYQKEFSTLKWGLIPFWSKDPTIGNKLINSRAETVAEKPAFREAFKKRRCLIPTDGFYEWQKQKQGPKQPYFIHMKNNQPFAYGGIWEQWKSPEGKKVETFSILTTSPNEIVKTIHNRMPVIIDSKDFDLWLDPSIHEQVELKPLLEPFDDSKMDAYPVSMYVNSPNNRGENCIAKLVEKTKQQKLI